MLDQAFEALKTYDWGKDRNELKAIDEAAAGADASPRSELEKRLAESLATGISRDAKDYVCRKLMVIGTAASAPALAALLPNPELSQMARFALERIPAPEAAQALRDALAQVTGALKVGMIASLGGRRDAESVPTLAALLNDSDAAVASAAARALGNIGGDAAAKALAIATPAEATVKLTTTDASLACAEGLLADGKKADALAVYKSLAGAEQPKHIRLAATRGMLACAGKQE